MNPEEEKRLEFVYEFNRLLDKMLDKSMVNSKSVVVIKLTNGTVTEISTDSLEQFI